MRVVDDAGPVLRIGVDLGEHREVVGELHVVALQRGGRRDHLERRARGLRGGVGGSREPQDVAVARVEHDGPARLATERVHGDRLDARVDRRSHRLPGRPVRRCEDSALRRPRHVELRAARLHRHQLPAGRARETRVEGQFEPADARALVRGIAGPLQLRLLFRIGCSRFPGDVDRVRAQRVRAAVDRSRGKRDVVLGHDRCAPAQLETTTDLLSGLQIGEGQIRRPRDLAAVDRQPQNPVDFAEQPRPHPNVNVDDVRSVDALGAVRVAGIDRGGGGDLLGFSVRGSELGGGVAGLSRIGELVAHRLEVLMGPCLNEAIRHVPLRIAGGADHPEDERDEGDDRKR